MARSLVHSFSVGEDATATRRRRPIPLLLNRARARDLTSRSSDSRRFLPGHTGRNDRFLLLSRMHSDRAFQAQTKARTDGRTDRPKRGRRKDVKGTLPPSSPLAPSRVTRIILRARVFGRDRDG